MLFPDWRPVTASSVGSCREVQGPRRSRFKHPRKHTDAHSTRGEWRGRGVCKFPFFPLQKMYFRLRWTCLYEGVWDIKWCHWCFTCSVNVFCVLLRNMKRNKKIYIILSHYVFFRLMRPVWRLRTLSWSCHRPTFPGQRLCVHWRITITTLSMLLWWVSQFKFSLQNLRIFILFSSVMN